VYKRQVYSLNDDKFRKSNLWNSKNKDAIL
jgi:hypothetical protein